MRGDALKRRRVATVSAVVMVAAATLVGVGAVPAARAAGPTLPAGFSDVIVKSGIPAPAAVAFAPDGHVFVASRTGRIFVYDSMSDPVAKPFADLTGEVFNAYDRGLLGLAVDPQFPARPYVYVMYAYDGVIGGPSPRWGTGHDWDTCPNPPGPNTDGCDISSRVSRLTAGGDAMTAENVLVEDYCQQFSSHSAGDLRFGPDGMLYASHGEGANYLFADYGQVHNPCGDPPGPAGTNLSPPNAEGGSLRAQSARRVATEPASLDGSVIRIDPDTGAGVAGNPMFASADPNRRRIVAMGMRNPFRFTFRPGTNELWIGDVGSAFYEEIDRVQNPTSAAVANFGWPCYEGNALQPAFKNVGLKTCGALVTDGSAQVPYYAYAHAAEVAPGDNCAAGSSSITGEAFYTETSYPARYANALFFADYSRSCIWYLPAGTNGLPDATKPTLFEGGAAGPVQLVTGPGGDVFYVDMIGGAIHEIVYTGRSPVAVATADKTAGYAPMSVQFSGADSADPDGGSLTYAWDLDGNGSYTDSTDVAPSRTYTDNGTYEVGLRVTDSDGFSGTTTITITVGNTPPTPHIDMPGSSLTWHVGESISFAGSASDYDQEIKSDALTWDLLIHHCPSNCHVHPSGEWSGVSSGSFVAPDHEYPSFLELRLTAVDRGGLSASTSVYLQPEPAQIAVASNPPGLVIDVDSVSTPAPYTSTVIAGSQVALNAPTAQVLNGHAYTFASWSDGGAANRLVTAPPNGTASYQANFTDGGCAPGFFTAQYFPNKTWKAPAAAVRCEPAIAYDWGTGAPPGIPVGPDNFSVRWTGAITTPAGPRNFWLSAADGVRLTVDGVQVIGAMHAQEPAASYSKRVQLGAGEHSVVLDYKELTGTKLVRLQQGPAPEPACTAWTAEYFSNMTLTGASSAAVCESALNQSWGNAGPPPLGGVPVDGFSVRWTRARSFAAATYTFSLTVNDGARVYVDGRVVIDAWSDRATSAVFTSNIPMTLGGHVITVEYYENAGPAAVKFSMTRLA